MKTIIKNTKQTIVSVVGISCVLFSVNSFSLDYIEDAKQYLAKGESKTAIIQLKNQLKGNPKDSGARFLLGTIYLRMGEFLKADKELSKAAELSPDNAQINLAYAELLLAKRDYKKVQALLAKSYSITKDESYRLAYLGYVALGSRQVADAVMQFNKSNQRQENTLAYNGLAKIAFIEKKYDRVERLLQKSLKLDSDNTEALQLMAKLFNVKEEYEEALKIYSRLLEKNNKNIKVYAERITTYLTLKQYDNAEKDIATALKLSPNDLHVTFLLAQISLQKGDYKSAQDASQKVFNIKDNHLPSMLILGISHFGLQNYNQADKYLTQYLSVKPNDLYVQNMLANVYLAQRKSDQALLMLEGLDKSVINSNPNLLLTLGSTYLLSGELKKGVSLLSKAQVLAPDNQEIRKKLVSGYLKSGNMEQAITSLETLANSESATKQYKYRLIVTYIQQKQLEKAERKLKAMIEQNNSDPGLYNLRAVINKLNGEEQKAIASYKKTLALKPDYIPAYMGLAQLAMQNKDTESAKKYYKKIILFKKEYIKAYIALAGIAEKENNLQQAEKILLKGYNNINNLTIKLKMAALISKFYIKHKQHEKIMVLAKELIRTHPKNISVLSFYAGAQIVNKQMAEAQKTLRTIIARNPQDIEHRILLANQLSIQNNESEEVIELLDTVITIRPDLPEGLTLKVVYLLKFKHYEQALENTEKLIVQFPDNAKPLKLKATVLLAQKKYNQALSTYLQAYRIQPNNKLLIIIVDLLNSQKRNKESLVLLQSELKKNENNTGIHFKLANIYQQNKQIEKAVHHYKKILQIQADNVYALNNLAGIYLKQNNPAALQLAKKAYEKAPESAAIIDTYAYILIKKGNIDKGIELLKKAISLSPASYDIILHLAEGYALKGQKDRAKQLLKPLLNETIQFPEKEKAKNLFNKL